MSRPPEWDPAVRRHWTLDSDVTHLNHGAFGAPPVPVREAQDALRAELEGDPTYFLDDSYQPRVDAARAAAAVLLGADPAGLVFVPNATAGVATAVASLPVRPGAEIVTTDHAYPAIRIALRRAAAAARAVLVEVPVDLGADPAASVLDALTPRTGLVVVDAITSPTAWVFPVERIVAGCRSAGVRCVVDAAHVPGHLPVSLDALDPDVWVGNLHKWAFAPRGTAVLRAAAPLRARLRPLVPSHGAGHGFRAEFDWSGTFDPTGWLATPAAVAFGDTLGLDARLAHNRALAGWGGRLVAERLGIPLPLPAPAHAAMVLVDPGPLSADQALALHRELRAARIDVPVSRWRDRHFVRVSAQVYNRAEDYERLAAVLPDALARARR